MKEAQVAEIWRLAYKLWLVVVLNICRGINGPFFFSSPFFLFVFLALLMTRWRGKKVMLFFV